MSGMTYEQRKRAIFEFLYRDPGGLLHRYRLPDHLSDDAIRDEVNLLVEDINGLIPTGYTDADFKLLMPEINGAIRRRHGAQGWPPAKVFIAATEDAVEATSKKKAAAEPTREFSLDPFEIASRRMQAGEPVGEAYLWGRQSVELIAKGLVDQTTMEGYRNDAYEAHRAQYGEVCADAWWSEGQARHQAAKEAYLARKHDDRPISEVEMARLQADLNAVGAAMDRRAQAMRRSA